MSCADEEKLGDAPTVPKTPRGHLSPPIPGQIVEPLYKCLSMPDRKKASAERAGRRDPGGCVVSAGPSRWSRGPSRRRRPFFAVLSVVAAVAIRTVYVITIRALTIAPLGTKVGLQPVSQQMLAVADRLAA